MQIQKLVHGRLFFCLTVIFCLTVSSFAQRNKQSDFKQLAGASEEVSAMRLPLPETLGTRSKTAMIPIKNTDNQTIEIPVDSSENFKLMIISPNTKNFEVEVAGEGDSFVSLKENQFDETTFGFDGNQFPAEVYSLDSVKAGKLQVRINQTALTAGEISGFIVASSDSPYQIYSYINSLRTVVGQEIGITAALFDKNRNSSLDVPQSLANTIRESRLIIRLPNNKELEFEMTENGNGLFRGSFVPTIAGNYVARVETRGTTPEGLDFIRTAEHGFQIETPVNIGQKASARMIDDLRWQINLPIEGLKASEKVIAHAEIWGRDTEGNEKVVAWIGGMALAQRNGKNAFSIPLTLDSRWLALSDAKTYEMRNVRLQNPDSSVLIGEKSGIPLPTVFLPSSVKDSFAGEITEEMRSGKRPARDTNSAVGGKLMLVHGYSSGDAWRTAAQFTNYVKFLDLNKNRSHDQFANLIRTFGASLPSFGIVAHSQGGAASLHLYTYYWSGLDYATGSRLIQSVGTPYQGTALAGNLAALGSVFGAGCGSNNDLTYSGAASWLAGIPTSSRAKVFYHTTSFTDVWYRYDYCSLATDLFLGDPEDGVVERAYAQLSGGNNMGHKTGWCHTTSMRDPGQTTDSSRNSTMNANAAR